MPPLPRRTPSALRPRVRQRRLRFRVKFNDNLRGNSPRTSHVQWIRLIVEKTSDFYRKMNKEISRASAVRKIRQELYDIIVEKVYNAYPDPGNRSGKLKRSTSVEGRPQEQGVVGGYTFFMDNAKAPAKQGDQQGKNYAIFFLYPEELHTFIKPRGQKVKPRTYRDFFGIEEDEGTVKAFMEQNAPHHIKDAVLRTFENTKPKKMQG